MSLEEIAVIALCLFGGYWGVSFLFQRKDRERGPQARMPLHNIHSRRQHGPRSWA